MKSVFLLLFLLNVSLFSYSQGKEFEPSGKVFAVIYTNFHRGISGNALDEAAFELERGYLGYIYNFTPQFNAKININVGSPDDVSPFSKIRRYAYFKNAYLKYTGNQFNVEFGLIGLKQFNIQKKVWGKRYLMKTLANEHRLGSSADLGINLHYVLTEKIDADLTMMNGEGYTRLQMDDIFKYSLGSTIRLPENFTSRIVYDIMHNEVSETTLTLFTSYDYRSKWNIAGEFVERRNNGWKVNHNIYGISVFTEYNINEKFQLFGRYDKIESNILSGESIPWHLADDGTALIAGIQYIIIKNIKMALNYQDWYPRAADLQESGFIYLNLEVKM